MRPWKKAFIGAIIVLNRGLSSKNPMTEVEVRVTEIDNSTTRYDKSNVIIVSNLPVRLMKMITNPQQAYGLLNPYGTVI